MEQAEEEREMARERAREEKEGEQAREEERGEKEREQARDEKGEGEGEGREGEGVKEEGEEKSEKKRRRQRRPWRVGGDGPWGVPTYPGAWTANLQLPCGSGLTREELLPVLPDCFRREWLVRSGN
jgi:hypothetical protein